MAVAGRSGKIDSRALGNWLAHHAADRIVTIGGEPIAMEEAGTRQGFILWRLV